MTSQLNLDKSKWDPVKLGELATEISIRIENPAELEIEKFVGLEHFVSGNLIIKSYKTTKDLTSATKQFQSGDILFARRNTYLRRASMVNFDGVCSGDAFVLRENQDRIVAGFLAFIVNSERLWDFANSNAAGTMSKRVKWRNLTNYEFLLPPKAKQAEIAELLWAMDDVIQKDKNLYKSIDTSFKTTVKSISQDNIQQKKYKKLKDVANILDNLRKPLNASQRNSMKGDIPYYGANGLVDYINEFIFDKSLVLVAEDGGDFKEFFSKEIAYKVEGKSWVNNHAHVLSPKNSSLTTDWLFYSLVHRNILKYITGSTRLKLNKSELEKIQIWMPDKDLMNKLTKEVKMLENSRAKIGLKLSASKSLQKSLINEIF